MLALLCSEVVEASHNHDQTTLGPNNASKQNTNNHENTVSDNNTKNNGDSNRLILVPQTLNPPNLNPKCFKFPSLEHGPAPTLLAAVVPQMDVHSGFRIERV